ncbi:MAG: TIGR01459 family HAD-type hydrolase [Burkholderiales bacterium]|nr:TIGR01459 family HAD-type hydrolase [Burkholderiales bacterium]
MTDGAGYGAVIPCQGVSALVDRYDGFIVDQWGVLHDGVRPYPGALVCLERLRAAGKRVVILSNSGRREADNIQLMARLGFPRNLFDRLICAGEDAREAIAGRSSEFHGRLGRRCYAFTQDGDLAVLEGLPVDIVDRVAEADFLIVLRMDSERRGLAAYEAELQAGIARGLPMVCANPDLSRVSMQGLLEGPGVLAQRYEELGGAVFYHGKPHPAIYRSCLKALGDPPAGRVLAVGDSVEHDVLGASRIGLRSALVTGGIHIEALGGAWGELPGAEAWRRHSATAVAQPDYLLPAFVW